MRGYPQILFLFLSTFIFANEAEVSEEVWIDGSSFYKSINHEKKSTLFFKEWSSYAKQFLEDDNYYVALQLGESFDPLPEDEVHLPSLKTVAAIADEHVRKEYYSFLENFGRTFGINYLVLPDSSGLSIYEKEILKEANRYSPYYFLMPNLLSFNIPDSKNEFESKISGEPKIWVADQEVNTRRLNKWSSKLSEKVRIEFFKMLGASKSVDFIPVFELSQSLKRSIFIKSIAVVDPNHKLPIVSEKVCYLGSDLELREWLEKYTEVLSYRVEDHPVIVDNREQRHEIMEGDIVLQSIEDPIISSALIFPEIDIDGSSIIIAQALFGAKEVSGRVNHPFSRIIENPMFLGYASPDKESMDINKLTGIDTLATHAIKRFATPGLQIAVVKNGSLVIEKSYGYYTYDSLIKVSTNTLYDIASLTKVVATLPAVALLVDQKKIDLDDSISLYLKEFANSNKGQVTIRQLLAHNGGLRSYVPFWSMMLDGDRLDAFYYKTPEDEAMDIRTYGLEPHPNMLDSLKSFIVKSNLIKNPQEYNYSDLGFMILHLIIEEVSGQSFDAFVYNHFFEPMGLQSTMFNPKDLGISFENIAPTEFDQRYRNYQVWGEVHDRNALVFGGVAGHAGLFSTASDLAKMISMFLNKGFYGGRQYISKETVELFNQRYFENNRRGLGWDKKDGKKDSASDFASDYSFGHTGFTGTMIWADPAEDLIFVFLSNRIYPDANNWRLGELNTRTKLHDLIYQSLGKTE